MEDTPSALKRLAKRRARIAFDLEANSIREPHRVYI